MRFETAPRACRPPLARSTRRACGPPRPWHKDSFRLTLVWCTVPICLIRRFSAFRRVWRPRWIRSNAGRSRARSRPFASPASRSRYGSRSTVASSRALIDTDKLSVLYSAFNPLLIVFLAQSLGLILPSPPSPPTHQTLQSVRTGVLVGAGSNDNLVSTFKQPQCFNPYTMQGGTLGNIANLVSFYLDLKGCSASVRVRGPPPPPKESNIAATC